MSWKESYRSATENLDSTLAVPEGFREEYPTLSEVLEGSRSESNGHAATPPATLNLFLEGRQLKFCIIPKVGNRVAFGCVAEAVKGLSAVESELRAGHYEWKLSKRRT